MKIIVAGQFDSAALDALRKSHELVLFSHSITDMEQLIDAEILVLRGHVLVDQKLLSHGPKLRLIIKAGSGTDNIDTSEVAARGIQVVTTPASATAVSELAILLLFAVKRHLLSLSNAVRNGDWVAKYSFVGNHLTNSSVGVLGFGSIGREVARLAHGIGMEIKAYDRSPEHPDKLACAVKLGVEFMPLEQVLETVDAISLHMPLTAETRHLLGAKELRRMRPGTVVVNTARAEIVERSALLDALKNGPLVGAGLDVHYQEPIPPDDPFLSMPNVVCTPHIGAQTWETHKAIGNRIIAAIETYSRNVN